MPKIKTNRSAKKRFSVTGSNYLYRYPTRHRHKLVNRSHSKKCDLKKTILLSRTNKHQVRILAPYL